ncbi:MAG: GAF domain-containing protein [Gaiellaceae bacterium]
MDADDELLEVLERIYSRADKSPADHAVLAVKEELVRLGADAAFVAVPSPDGNAVEVARVTRYSEHPVRLAFSINAPYPLAEVLRRGDALFIASNEHLRCDHPGLLRLDDEDHACATLPLRGSDGALLGALNLGFGDPHEFDSEERAAIEQLAQKCAAVLGRPAVA